MSTRRAESLQRIGAAVAGQVMDGALLGLGSGSTVASLLPNIAREMKKRGVTRARWVPTSIQIQLEAQRVGLELSPLIRAGVDLVLDGADQVDEKLNLIKGGGGALLKEKVLLSIAKTSIIVADERKFAKRLCDNGVRVPVEASPFAREPLTRRLRELGGEPILRLDQRGFPFYTENGNVILDTLFEPIQRPAALEREVKMTPGVVEVGIFSIRPLEVYRLEEDGGFRTLRKR
ncbi:MAG: ribose 5-phosphate isomerase A [Thaumarchaeota archaeon]|nr:ribose 5-phosphate isomerase A [Nitrososphaerota archaeon]